jgi:hypothetical protein
MVAHACNPSTLEAETRELKVPGQPGLHCETLSEKENIAVIFKTLAYSYATELSLFFISTYNNNKK